MKFITNDVLNNIEKNIFNRGRDIDVCLYNGLFYSEFKETILDCLTAFENNDGGFGSGLQIDNYDTSSSVFQTYEALRLIDMVDINPNTDNELLDHIINKAGNYLFNKNILDNNKWNPFNNTTKNFAHSSLYENTSENRSIFGYHPTLALVGYILKYVKPTKAYYKKAIKLGEAIILDLLAKESFTKYEFISINSFIHSVKNLNLFNNLNELENKTIELGLLELSSNYSSYDEILPLDVALHINSNVLLNAKKEEQLDYIVDSIESHGLWEYNRDWGNNIYPEEASAKLKWLGAISVYNLYLLKLYNRIK